MVVFWFFCCWFLGLFLFVLFWFGGFVDFVCLVLLLLLVLLLVLVRFFVNQNQEIFQALNPKLALCQHLPPKVSVCLSHKLNVFKDHFN